MITYSVESVDGFYASAKQLLLDYWLEADERRDSAEMSLDLGVYRKLESIGMLQIFTAREGEEMLGFVIFTVAPCQHTGKIKAGSEISYVVPGMRGTGLIDDLFNRAGISLKQDGAEIMFCTLKAEFPHEEFVKRTGFKHVENVYMKEIT